MSDAQEKLALVLKISAQEVLIRRQQRQIEGMEMQLALTKHLYARDLKAIDEHLQKDRVLSACGIINKRLNHAGEEIDITDDDVLDALRALDRQTGSKGSQG
jgi:hypothetical protein